MVIPSSVHEVIVVKRDDVDAAEMANIIQEVNKDQVSERERLGTHPYIF